MALITLRPTRKLGKPCKHGRIHQYWHRGKILPYCERYKSNGACVACQAILSSVQDHPKCNLSQRRYRLENKDKINAQQRDRYQKEKEKREEYVQEQKQNYRARTRLYYWQCSGLKIGSTNFMEIID